MTTCFGMVSAMCLAASQVPQIPDALHLVLVCISAACVAGLGYHASDIDPRPPFPPALATILLLVVLSVILCACKVGGFGLAIKSPTFGSVELNLDGGVIGHGKLVTNEPTPRAVAP